MPDLDFEWEPAVPALPLKLRSYQREWRDATARDRALGFSRLLLDAVGGSGKCLGRGTPVLMFDGSVKPAEAIVTGDILMGPDSSPRLVSSTCSGIEMLYKIKPVKGDEYVVNESHILSLKATCGTGKLLHHGNRYNHGDVINVSVLDFLAERKAFHHSSVGWRTAVEFQSKAIHPDLPPYMLGLWLGDGTAVNFSISKPDPEVYEAVKQYADSIGHFVRTATTSNGNGTCLTHYVTESRGRSSMPGHKTNRAKNALEDLNILSNKHIPHSYKTNTRAIRLEVLAGILDADGSLSNGCIDYISVSRRLCEDVAFLARSLGLAAYMRPCKKGCQGGFVGDYFRLNISGDCDMIPFRIPRRKPAPRKQIKNVLVTGIKAESIGIGEYFGFSLIGPDRLFVLGDFTVTHNTSYAAAIAHNDWHTRQGRTLILENRQQLVAQTAKRMAYETGLSVDVEMGDQHASPYAPIVVASVASLGRINRLTSFSDDHFSVVFADEAHNSTANLFLRIMRYFSFGKESLAPDWQQPKDGTYTPKATIIGITATPDTFGKRNLGNFYQKFVARYSYLQAIEDGWLVGIKEINIPVKIDTRNFRKKASGYGGMDFSSEDESNAIIPIIEELAEQIVTHASTRKTMCFLPSKECAMAMSAALNRRGLKSLYVLGECLDRDEKTDEFQAHGSGICLCLCAMYVEGTDFPSVDTVAWMRATLSPSFYKQGVYRMSRTLPGIVNDAMTPEERRAAIASSAKPFGLLISPFFVSDRVDICSVVDLFVDPALKEKMKKAPKYFTDAAKLRDFIAALEKAADKHRNRQPRTIDPVLYSLSVGADKIAALAVQDSAPASRAELDTLLAFGIDTTAVKTSVQAQRLISTLRERERLGLASPKTLVQLKLRLHWPDELATRMKQSQAGVLVAKGIRYRKPVDDGTPDSPDF